MSCLLTLDPEVVGVPFNPPVFTFLSNVVSADINMAVFVAQSQRPDLVKTSVAADLVLLTEASW